MITVDVKELEKIMLLTPSSQNILLCGKHGIGKSQILTKYFEKQGTNVVTLFLGQMSDPGDLIGLPKFNQETGLTEFMPPYWFPIDGKPIVLFLDELNRAREEILQTIMDLTLNRKLAGHELPKGSRMISAINVGEDYQVTDLDPALISRFNIYEFIPSVNDWLDWASKNDIDKRVINFIEHNREFLDSDGISRDYSGLEKTPDRRGWQRVSDLVKDREDLDETDKKLIAGIIGVKSTNKFFQTLSSSRNVSGEELLFKDFTQTVKKLEKLSTPELCVLNDSVFRCLEQANNKEKKTGIIEINLSRYLNFLEERKKSEVFAHFCNNFSSTHYPNAILFFLEHCSELYEKLTEFIASIQ